MPRTATTTNKIALLATGDEICNGDIVNSNAQEIAQQLFNQGMNVGTHMATSDHIHEIEVAIQYLLQNHQALIITGGLGPTSDDLTRYALANATQRELIFDESAWDIIVARLKRIGYDTPPESNRRQAFFPKDAVIIPNPNGTAAGCVLQYGQQWIFMLPGPPLECLPMLEQVVLPTLKKANFMHPFHFHKWLLFGVSEGQIAEELDAIAKTSDCTTGYRLCYPYLEFKLSSQNKEHFTALIPQIEQAVAQYLIGDGSQTASEKLQHILLNQKTPLIICDLATGGMLEAALKTPETKAHVHFTTENLAAAQVKITGLEEFWQANKEVINATLEMTFTHHPSIKTTIPFRNYRVRQYAVEFICKEILSKIYHK